MRPEDYIDLFLKGIVAFFIPLGWALILYPLMRRLHKSWYVLVAAVSILSFSTFILKEKLDTLTPDFDQFFAYGLGIFFGIALLSYVFNFKHQWLKVLPESEIRLDTYKIKKGIELSHLLQAAILIEEEAKNFYGALAKKVQDSDVKNLCQWLAQEEIKHKNLLEETFFRWLPSPTSKEILGAFTQELKTIGVFLNPPLPDTTEEDMARYAIDQERKTAQFYLSFEKAFPLAWKRINIEMLAMAERAHASKLIAAYQGRFDLT